DPDRGNLIALISGAAWALTIAGLRSMGKRSHNIKSTTATVIAGNVIAFLVCLPMALPVSEVSLPNATVLFYLGVFQIGLAYVFLNRSLREVPALEAATLLLIEPVLNPVW